MIRLLFFSSLREKLNAQEMRIEWRAGVPVRHLVEALREAYPAVAEDLKWARIAVNERLVNQDHAVAYGDDVAFLMPVSGG